MIAAFKSGELSERDEETMDKLINQQTSYGFHAGIQLSLLQLPSYVEVLRAPGYQPVGQVSAPLTMSHADSLITQPCLHIKPNATIKHNNGIMCQLIYIKRGFILCYILVCSTVLNNDSFLRPHLLARHIARKVYNRKSGRQGYHKIITRSP